MAAHHGVSREEMMGIVLATGFAIAPVNDSREAAPTPPDGPVNDAPPPSGRRRT